MPPWLMPAVAVLLTLFGLLGGFAVAWGAVRSLVDDLRVEVHGLRSVNTHIAEVRGEISNVVVRVESLEELSKKFDSVDRAVRDLEADKRAEARHNKERG